MLSLHEYGETSIPGISQSMIKSTLHVCVDREILRHYDLVRCTKIKDIERG